MTLFWLLLGYTMNARGAFTPHEVEEYAVDKRYPGYLLSREASSVTLDQLHREKPKMFLPNGQVDWDVSFFLQAMSS